MTGIISHPLAPQVVNDGLRDLSCAFPCVVNCRVCVSPAMLLLGRLPLAGFGWLGAFFTARRRPSCKIISAAPHVSVSVSNLPMHSLYCIGGSPWRVSHPRARVNHPRTALEKR